MDQARELRDLMVIDKARHRNYKISIKSWLIMMFTWSLWLYALYHLGDKYVLLLSRPLVAGRSCGIKAQLGSALFSLFLGWWGFPWGFVMTPIQIVRNLVGLAKGPDPAQPSEQLHRMVRIQMAGQVLAAQQHHQQQRAA